MAETCSWYVIIYYKYSCVIDCYSFDCWSIVVLMYTTGIALLKTTDKVMQETEQTRQTFIDKQGSRLGFLQKNMRKSNCLWAQHFDRIVFVKRDQLVDRKKSHLSIQNKLLIYKAVIHPIWSYGKELWCCAGKSNIVITQRSQSTILRATANAPLYVTNHSLHTDCNINYVSDVIHERMNKYHNKLYAQPNPLLEPLLQPINTRRLKRCWPLRALYTLS